MKQVMNYRWSDIGWMAGVALAYAILAKVALSFFAANGVVSLVWPSSGLALAALMVGGKKYWPGVFVGALAGNLMAGSPIVVSILIASGNTLEALTCVFLLSLRRSFNLNLTKTHDFIWLAAVSTIGSCIGALIGVATLLFVGLITQQQVSQNLLHWWQGDLLGIFLVTPLILVWRHLPNWNVKKQIIEIIACFSLAFLAGQIIFLGWFHHIFGESARGFWVFLFVTWAATRFGRHGVLLIIVITAIQMLLGMVLEVGGFATNQVPTGMLNFWIYMLVLTGVGLLLSIIIDNLKSTEVALRQSHDIFSKMSQHVPGVIYQFKMFPDGRFCFPFANDAIEDIYEVTAEQVREDASAVFAILHPEDFDGIVASIQESAATLNQWKHQYRVILPSQGVRWRLGQSQPEKLEDGSVLWHGFITDITERKSADIRIVRLKQLYQALSEVNQAIVRMEQNSELFPLVCRCAVVFGGMKMAWVGQLDDSKNIIKPVASYGDPSGYLDNLKVYSLADSPEGQTTTGKALRENRAIIINDFLNNPMTAPWHHQARALGWASAAAFPMQRGGQPFAVLTVCHAEINAFDDETIELLKEMSADISFALDNFDRETRRKAADESLRLAASVYDTSSEGILITDAENQIIAVNPAFTSITGYLDSDVIGKKPNIFKSGRHDDAFYEAMWHELNTSGYWQGEIWDRRKNGDIYPKWLTINTVFNDDGSVQRRVAMFTDISQRREAEQLIWRQANFDVLTGLPNRQMFLDRLSQEIKKAHRTALPMTLMFIDLDRFKEVNDTLGHDMGDILLREAANRLSSCVRETDTVARLGGDEFTVIIGELDDINAIERVGQDILHILAEPFQLGNDVSYISASIGITQYPDDATDVESLLKNADQAMYAAKQHGRNRYHYFTPVLQEAAQSRMHMTNELRYALSENQFKLFYQPILELATNAIHKAEALIRWEHPKRGLISPAEFIPIAEDTGLIVDIGEWVFREAAGQALIWRDSLHPDFQISINKSPVQFNNEKLRYVPWTEQLQQLGLPGESIVVEITEGMLMDASAAVNHKLLGFRDVGIQVALDDFGTGYSSLSYLKKFDIDYIKIDISFVRNLAPDNDDFALCKAIIMMAHTLGIKVIAEGIETTQQRDLLLLAGCDYGQGYLFSRPVSPLDFEKLLSQQG
jgi:diguanylate cyclase (GGDEF)-like protein/PAS domain S-box-containing protein